MIVGSKQSENSLRDEPLWPWYSQPGIQLAFPEKMVWGRHHTPIYAHHRVYILSGPYRGTRRLLGKVFQVKYSAKLKGPARELPKLTTVRLIYPQTSTVSQYVEATA